jgi:hypothetical protein
MNGAPDQHGDDRTLWRRVAPPAPDPARWPSPLELAAYLDGRLDDADRVEAAIAGDPDLLASVRDARGALATGPAADVTPRMIEAACRLVRADAAGSHAPASSWRIADWLRVGRWAAAAAASILIGIAGYWLGRLAVVDGSPSGSDLVAEASFGVLGEETDEGDVFAFAFPLETSEGVIP